MGRLWWKKWFTWFTWSICYRYWFVFFNFFSFLQKLSNMFTLGSGATNKRWQYIWINFLVISMRKKLRKTLKWNSLINGFYFQNNNVVMIERRRVVHPHLFWENYFFLIEQNVKLVYAFIQSRNLLIFIYKSIKYLEFWIDHLNCSERLIRA